MLAADRHNACKIESRHQVGLQSCELVKEDQYRSLTPIVPAQILQNQIESESSPFLHLFDNNKKLTSPLLGVPLSFGIQGLRNFVNSLSDLGINTSSVNCVSAIGGPNGLARESMLELMVNYGFRSRSVIHPHSFQSKTATIGENVQLLAGSIVGSFAFVSHNVIVNTGATVDHDCFVDKNSHIGPGATLAGEIHIEKNCFIGANSTILPKIRIGSNSIVGAGSVVTKDVTPGSVVAGNPARTLLK